MLKPCFALQQTLKDLFEEPSGLTELADDEEQKEKPTRESRRRLERKKEKEKAEEEKSADTSLSQEQMEQV